MKKLLKKIEHLSHFDETDDLVKSLLEELGETSTAILVEDGKKERVLDEPSSSECVDVVICALALYFKRGGKRHDLQYVMEMKLDKWENR